MFSTPPTVQKLIAVINLRDLRLLPGFLAAPFEHHWCVKSVYSQSLMVGVCGLDWVSHWTHEIKRPLNLLLISIHKEEDGGRTACHVKPIFSEAQTKRSSF